MGNTMSMKLITIDELAELLSVSKTHIYKQVKKGTIPFHKVGAALRFNYDEVVEATRQEPVSDKSVSAADQS
jgi:excisionase family DNA binding protein